MYLDILKQEQSWVTEPSIVQVLKKSAPLLHNFFSYFALISVRVHPLYKSMPLYHMHFKQQKN